jgi:hypothetical protein
VGPPVVDEDAIVGALGLGDEAGSSRRVGETPISISGREKPADWYNQSPPWQSVEILLGDWRILVPCLN